MKTRIQDVSALEPTTFALCQHIRRQVFCQEQNIAESLEWDGLDDQCRHLLAWADGVAVGTARARPYGDNLFKIERVAVLKSHRGQGLGQQLMNHFIALGTALGAAQAVLNAQVSVRDFYAKLGFIAEGPEFVEADIPHVHMRRKLS